MKVEAENMENGMMLASPNRGGVRRAGVLLYISGLFFLVWLLLVTSGCVAMRGVHFGHIAGAGSDVPLMRVFTSDHARLHGGERILLLPPAGEGSDEAKRRFQQDLYRCMRLDFSASVITVGAVEHLQPYVTESNLLTDDGFFDIREAALLGRLLGFSHVAGVYVNADRAYHPQVKDIRVMLISVRDIEPVAVLEGVFDASEQKVVVALADYLQRRRARVYSTTSLDVMLRSPAEYSAFVAALCSRRLAHTLWRTRGQASDLAAGAAQGRERL